MAILGTRRCQRASVARRWRGKSSPQCGQDAARGITSDRQARQVFIRSDRRPASPRMQENGARAAEVTDPRVILRPANRRGGRPGPAPFRPRDGRSSGIGRKVACNQGERSLKGALRLAASPGRDNAQPPRRSAYQEFGDYLLRRPYPKTSVGADRPPAAKNPAGESPRLRRPSRRGRAPAAGVGRGGRRVSRCSPVQSR